MLKESIGIGINAGDGVDDVGPVTRCPDNGRTVEVVALLELCLYS